MQNVDDQSEQQRLGGNQTAQTPQRLESAAQVRVLYPGEIEVRLIRSVQLTRSTAASGHLESRIGQVCQSSRHLRQDIPHFCTGYASQNIRSPPLLFILSWRDQMRSQQHSLGLLADIMRMVYVL